MDRIFGRRKHTTKIEARRKMVGWLDGWLPGCPSISGAVKLGGKGERKDSRNSG